MNNEWAFAPMTSSNSLLGDSDAVRARLREDGYLYFRDVVDHAPLIELRRKMLTIMERTGWVMSKPLMRGVAISGPYREGDPEYFEVYDEIQKLEEFHVLAHHAAVLGIMRQVVGETAFPHPLKVARIAFPTNYAASTPPHQDYLNNQGTQDLTAAWMPLSDCPMELGSLAILRGSNHFGVLPLQFHLGPGNRRAVIPPDMLQELRWVTSNFGLGDVVLFPSLTIHAALHNAAPGRLRLSVDYRYQCEGQALTPMVLEPHFGRLSWEEIYAGWKSDQHQYYWKDLNYEVVPFDQTEFDKSKDPGDFKEYVRYEWIQQRRRSQEGGD